MKRRTHRACQPSIGRQNLNQRVIPFPLGVPVFFRHDLLRQRNVGKRPNLLHKGQAEFKIDFPFPEPEYRGLIWKGLIPAECPTDPDLDFDELGRNYELSGGHIKNAVVRAAYRAAGRGGHITARDIELAAEQECKNAGKLFRTAPADDW